MEHAKTEKKPAKNPLDKNTRVTYLADPENPKRVMTLVTRVDDSGECYQFAFSMNRPEDWIVRCRTKQTILAERKSGDIWDKRKGLELALKRLEHAKFQMTPAEGTPKIAALRILSEGSNGIAKRIANNALAAIDHPYTVGLRKADVTQLVPLRM